MKKTAMKGIKIVTLRKDYSSEPPLLTCPQAERALGRYLMMDVSDGDVSLAIVEHADSSWTLRKDEV